MRNEEILAYWSGHGVVLTTYRLESVEACGFKKATLDLLQTVGLPVEADPFLNFDRDFKSVSTSYRIGAQFAHFIRIGFDSAGNPLVINTEKEDLIEWLDHETQFAPHYVNCSLQALSASMVLYHQFVENLLATRGPDAYEKADFTDEQLTELKTGLSKIDEQAVLAKGFWQGEFTTLLANRAYYKTSENSL
ncbi:SUKH-4 family immunity protein [Hymenobacter sp. BRD67]|uniref:SUKH-4 family immunity protein n=1 Tax=Hymenobacter sp. BRD67 TaxID=2675877 RepID=UPI00156639FC|nr:SUKH-4 family immunity protein [Hymenobacter sp. BRD67]QKG54981.1 SUKH-4 family immunity protein [Hymenobacter sp. BRD67]